MSERQVSVIIPTLNEAENLPVLIPRIADVLRGQGLKYEIIVVDDDSRDDTRGVCAKLAEQYPLALIVRREIKDGLSGAVLQGMATNATPVLASLRRPAWIAARRASWSIGRSR